MTRENQQTPKQLKATLIKSKKPVKAKEPWHHYIYTVDANAGFFRGHVKFSGYFNSNFSGSYLYSYFRNQVLPRHAEELNIQLRDDNWVILMFEDLGENRT